MAAVTLWEMKVSLLRCMCVVLVSTHLAGCGDQAASEEPALAAAAGAEDGAARASDSGGAAAQPFVKGAEETEQNGAEAAELTTLTGCPELDEQPASCGRISIRLKGRGSSCRLMPTASDLTRSPRSVHFDCTPLARGPNGYDFDATGHITLTGDTCDALQTGGPHRVTLLLACGPG